MTSLVSSMKMNIVFIFQAVLKNDTKINMPIMDMKIDIMNSVDVLAKFKRYTIWPIINKALFKH